jgi:hypothetical protein
MEAENSLFNDHWRNKEGIRKFLESNKNENTMHQHLWDIAKAVLRGKFMKTHIKKPRETPNKWPNNAP